MSPIESIEPPVCTFAAFIVWLRLVQCTFRSSQFGPRVPHCRITALDMKTIEYTYKLNYGRCLGHTRTYIFCVIKSYTHTHTQNTFTWNSRLLFRFNDEKLLRFAMTIWICHRPQRDSLLNLSNWRRASRTKYTRYVFKMFGHHKKMNESIDYYLIWYKYFVCLFVFFRII